MSLGGWGVPKARLVMPGERYQEIHFFFGHFYPTAGHEQGTDLITFLFTGLRPYLTVLWADFWFFLQE